MYMRTRAWLKVLLAGGCMLQLSSCIGDPDYFIVSMTANWITAATVRSIFDALAG